VVPHHLEERRLDELEWPERRRARVARIVTPPVSTSISRSRNCPMARASSAAITGAEAQGSVGSVGGSDRTGLMAPSSSTAAATAAGARLLRACRPSRCLIDGMPITWQILARPPEFLP
jgi:hypothetical protein